MKKETIIKNLDLCISYLGLIKNEVKKGTPERIDALDMMNFVSVGLDATYKGIKQHFKIKEE